MSVKSLVTKISKKFGLGDEELLNNLVVDGDKISFQVDMIDDEFQVEIKLYTPECIKAVEVKYKKVCRDVVMQEKGMDFKQWYKGLLVSFQKERNRIIDMYDDDGTTSPLGSGDQDFEFDMETPTSAVEDMVLEYGDEIQFSGGGADDLTNLMLLRESPFQCITSEQIKKMESEAVGKITDVLDIDEGGARIILRKHRWAIEKIMNKFATFDRKQILVEAGLATIEQSKMRVEKEVTCQICFSDHKAEETTLLRRCGHCACNECWRGYLSVKIQDGAAKTIKCMFPKCKSVVDGSVVHKLITVELNPKEMEKYDQKILDSFVEDNDKMKWCQSTPFCGRAAEVRVHPETPLEIHCECSHVWCFNCLLEPHLPASCVMLQFWKKKCADDSETLNWIKSNTRDCPKCKNATEKNGGCNHITCQSCGAHWCWACGGEFNASSVYGHGCNKYKGDDSGSSQSRSESRASLERYLHYFNHYNSHFTSIKNQEKMRANIRRKVRAMYKHKPNSAWVEIEWLKNGMEVLFETRRALMMSYVFAFYLFDKVAQKKALKGCRMFRSTSERKRVKDLFEVTQQYLEETTEQLAKFLDKDLKEMLTGNSVKNGVMKHSVLNEKSVHALFDIIRKEMIVDGEYFLPEPPYICTQPSYEANTISREQKKNFRSHSNPPPKPKPKPKPMTNREENELQMAIQASLMDFGQTSQDDLELQRVLMLSLQEK